MTVEPDEKNKRRRANLSSDDIRIARDFLLDIDSSSSSDSFPTPLSSPVIALPPTKPLTITKISDSTSDFEWYTREFSQILDREQEVVDYSASPRPDSLYVLPTCLLRPASPRPVIRPPPRSSVPSDCEMERLLPIQSFPNTPTPTPHSLYHPAQTPTTQQHLLFSIPTPTSLPPSLRLSLSLSNTGSPIDLAADIAIGLEELWLGEDSSAEPTKTEQDAGDQKPSRVPSAGQHVHFHPHHRRTRSRARTRRPPNLDIHRTRAAHFTHAIDRSVHTPTRSKPATADRSRWSTGTSTLAHATSAPKLGVAAKLRAYVFPQEQGPDQNPEQGQEHGAARPRISRPRKCKPKKPCARPFFSSPRAHTHAHARTRSDDVENSAFALAVSPTPTARGFIMSGAWVPANHQHEPVGADADADANTAQQPPCRTSSLAYTRPSRQSRTLRDPPFPVRPRPRKSC